MTGRLQDRRFHGGPALRVRRQGPEHRGQLTQPDARVPARLQCPLRVEVELERGRDLEREKRRVARQLDLLVRALGEHAQRPRQAREPLADVLGERRQLGGVDRLIVEFLDLGDAIGLWARHPAAQHEAALAHREDVGAPVGERFARADQRHTAHVAKIRRGVGGGRAVRGHVCDPEPPIGGETVGEQPAVAGLEDVQRLRSPGEEDNRQRKNGKLTGHAIY